MRQFHPHLIVLFLVSSSLTGVTGCTQEESNGKTGGPMLECRIIVNKTEDTRYSNEVARLWVELQNISNKAVDIKYTTDPILQHLKGEVRNPDGKVVLHDFGEGLSPYSFQPTIQTLKPGQTVTTNYGLGLLGTRGPGVYRIQVVFDHEKMKAVSSSVEVHLKAIQKK